MYAPLYLKLNNKKKTVDKNDYSHFQQREFGVLK